MCLVKKMAAAFVCVMGVLVVTAPLLNVFQLWLCVCVSVLQCARLCGHFRHCSFSADEGVCCCVSKKSHIVLRALHTTKKSINNLQQQFSLQPRLMFSENKEKKMCTRRTAAAAAAAAAVTPSSPPPPIVDTEMIVLEDADIKKEPEEIEAMFDVKSSQNDRVSVCFVCGFVGVDFI